jgi:hypothetical protein
MDNKISEIKDYFESIEDEYQGVLNVKCGTY